MDKDFFENAENKAVVRFSYLNIVSSLKLMRSSKKGRDSAFKEKKFKQRLADLESDYELFRNCFREEGKK